MDNRDLVGKIVARFDRLALRHGTVQADELPSLASLDGVKLADVMEFLPRELLLYVMSRPSDVSFMKGMLRLFDKIEAMLIEVERELHRARGIEP